MARISLKEAYDNKDVVAQIYAIRDIAEGASDTADNAVTTANDAKTYVDTLGPQVEGAVQTANEASASAQTSAQTVAGYDARLTEVEGDLNQAESDIDGLETGLNAVTLRVQTAEGNIVTIQGRVTTLETADGQSVKLTGEHAIGNYAVLLTGNQTKSGRLTITDNIISFNTGRTGNAIHVRDRNVAGQADIPTSTSYTYPLVYEANDGGLLAYLVMGRNSAGKSYCQLSLIDANGVTKNIMLGISD